MRIRVLSYTLAGSLNGTEIMVDILVIFVKTKNVETFRL